MRRLLISAAAIALMGGAALAQEAATVYGDKLGVMPRSNTNQPMIDGTGTVEAKLEGSSLKVTGSFEGMKGDATTLTLHQARPGMAGPEIASTDLAGGKSGTIDASFELSPDQVKLLQENHLYVVVSSSRSKTGELRAWLMAK